MRRVPAFAVMGPSRIRANIPSGTSHRHWQYFDGNETAHTAPAGFKSGQASKGEGPPKNFVRVPKLVVTRGGGGGGGGGGAGIGEARKMGGGGNSLHPFHVASFRRG